jgi:hypothetical protein
LKEQFLEFIFYVYHRFRDATNSVPWYLDIKFENDHTKEEEWIEPKLQSNRRFVKVSLDESLDWSISKVLDFYTKHGTWINELKLVHCGIDNITFFVKIMNKMPNLKKLVMTHTGAIANYDAEDIPLFNKLETLELLKCEYEMLDYFKNAKLSTFKVMSSMDGHDQGIKPLIEFLATQKNLKTLALRWFDTYNSRLFKTPIDTEKIPFKLKRLSLLKFELRNMSNDYSNLLMFLQTQAKSVEELELGRAFPDFIFEFVFSKFTKLRKLKINIKGIPSEMEVYNRLVNNPIVKILIIAGSEPDSIEAIQAFMRHLPNIESLTFCKSQSDELMQFISTNFVRLRYLNAWDISGLQSPTVEILNIKTIATTDWNLVHAANPKIKEIHVKCQMFGAETSIIQMIQVLNLSVLRIGGVFFSADSNFFEAVRANLAKFKLLSVARKSLRVPESDVADIPTLRYLSELDMEVINKIDDEFWNDSDYGTNTWDLFPQVDEDVDWFANDDPLEHAFELNEMMEELGIYNAWDDFDDDFDDDDGDDDNDYDL